MPAINPHTVVTLKKRWVGIAGVILLGIGGVVGFNGVQSSHVTPTATPKTPPSTPTVANAGDQQWMEPYLAHPVRASVTPARPAQTTAGNGSPPTPILETKEPTPVPLDDPAMRAPLTSNQLVIESPTIPLTAATATPAANTSLQTPTSRYVLQAGSVIPAILITGINSDLPGQIIGHVRENVYDSVTGTILLIPQGTKCLGSYDAKLNDGQARVFVSWQRLILPNGQSLDLHSLPGTDTQGYAGLSDQVNTHVGRFITSSLLMSVLGAGAQLSQPAREPSASNDVSRVLAEQMGTNLVNTATALTEKNSHCPPTVEIRPGCLMTILVTQDIDFGHAYREVSGA